MKWRTSLVLLLLTCHSAWAEDPSVLVTTARPQLGSLPDLVSTFGTAAPALNGGMTLSLPQDGRVLSIAVTPGEQVRAGKALIEFEASATTSGTYQQAGTTLTLAQTQRAHTAQLLAQQMATRDQLAQADKLVSDARSALNILVAQGANRPRSTLQAPFDGIIGTVPVAQGDRVASGSPLLIMTRLDGLVVTVGVEPGQRRKVKPGQLVQLQRLDGGLALQGKVLRIDSVLNQKTRLIDCDVGVEAGSVISGEAFRADIVVGDFAGWILPRDAVQVEDKGAHIFQVVNGKAVQVEVTILGAQIGTYVVAGSVAPKDPIVLTGGSQLSGGAAVRQAR